MKIYKTIILLNVLFIFINCNYKNDKPIPNELTQKKDTIMSYNITEIKKHIELQERVETEEEEYENPYNLSIIDLELVSNIIKWICK